MSVAEVKSPQGQTFKLGRKIPASITRQGNFQIVVHDDKSISMAPMLGAYSNGLRASKPIPASTNWQEKGKASIAHMYKNDQYGDCVIAGKYHAVGVWSGNDKGTAIEVQDKEVVDTYFSWCGPGDNGCNIGQVLDRFKAKGLPCNGQTHKIDGYVAIENSNVKLIKLGIYLFGGLTLGIDLPGDWTSPGTIWDVSNKRIVGGHDVRAVDFDDKYVHVSTWGGISRITWAAFTDNRWVSEVYCELSPDWYNEDKLSPHGFDVAKLKADLDSLGQGQPPVIPDDPTPPTPPVPPVPPTPVPTETATMTLHGTLVKGQFFVISNNKWVRVNGMTDKDLPKGNYKMVPVA